MLDHLWFELKHEGFDLGLLSSLLGRFLPQAIAEKNSPTLSGSYNRRAWVLDEWLTGDRMHLANIDRGDYASVMDSRLQFVGIAHCLFRVLSTNGGHISSRNRSSSFAALTDEQVGRIEEMYNRASFE